MLKCTALIYNEEHDYTESRKLNVPVLPRNGDVVTYKLGESAEMFKVTSIEYEMSPHTGDCTAINVHLSKL